MAVVVVVAVAMVRVPMPAQDDKDERIDQDPHQRQDEHYCTPKFHVHALLQCTCGRLRLAYIEGAACYVHN